MCSWMVNVEKGYNITLHFELFQTEKEFDILEVFDGEFELFLTFRPTAVQAPVWVLQPSFFALP